jgi:hypothetical protein
MIPYSKILYMISKCPKKKGKGSTGTTPTTVTTPTHSVSFAPVTYAKKLDDTSVSHMSDMASKVAGLETCFEKMETQFTTSFAFFPKGGKRWCVQLHSSGVFFNSLWHDANKNTSCYPREFSFATFKASSYDTVLATMDCTMTRIPSFRYGIFTTTMAKMH